VYLLHLGIWTDVELHHVLEAENLTTAQAIEGCFVEGSRGAIVEMPLGEPPPSPAPTSLV
jgi:hypothetical protein